MPQNQILRLNCEVDELKVELPELEDFIEEEVQLDELEVWELLLPYSLDNLIRIIFITATSVITQNQILRLKNELFVFKKMIAFMYKNMYKWVTDRIAKFSSLEADEPEIKLPELTIFISTNMSIPRNQFLRIIISFLEICSKINPQVSLHRLIRLISMNRKLMNRKLSHRN